MKTHNIGIKTFLLLALLFTGGMALAQVQINGNVYGGGNLGIVTENTTVTVNGGTIGRKLTFDERSNDENGQVIHVDNGNVYGGGNGFKIDSYRRINKDDGYGVWALDVPNINPNYGLVKGNTNVTVSGNAVVRRAVYGGGNVATVGFAEIPQATGIADYTSGGKTTVTIEGHALIGPKKEDLTMDDAGNALPQADVNRNFKYLGANEGFVFGSSRGISGGALKHLSFADTTIVTITGNAQVAGHVFGGGENGHVQKGTNVIIKGDAIIGGVPLHGDSTGVAAGTQMVYTVSGGEYDGVTLYLNKEEGELNEDIYGVGHRVFRGNVFGGGKGTDFISWWKEQHGFNKYCYTAGRVYGNTHVAIEGNAQIYNRVYGGGTIASVGTFKHEDSSNANAVTNIESGGHSYVTVSNGIIGSPGSDGKNCGEVFGGGRGIPGRPRKGTESFMTLHQLPDEAYVGHTHVLVTGGTIMNSVYGGGANGHVQGDANVRITDGTIGIEGVGGWHGNVYAGGGGTARYTEGNAKKFSITAGRVFGNTNLNITGGTIMHNVYGGGALASVGTYLKYKGVEQAYFGGGKATLNITGGTIGTNGDNNGMVYGSGRGEIMAPDQIMDTLTYMAYTFVNIGSRTVDPETGEASLSGDAKIKGSVYGSGENGHVYLESHVNVYSGTIGIAAEDYDPDNPDPHFAYRGNVYGAGCGTDKFDSDNDGVGDTYNPNSGYVWGQTEVNIYGGYISRSVYGAGAMASVGFIDHTRTKKHHYINHESEPSLSWPYELTYGKITDSLNHVYPSEEGVFTGKSTVNVFGGHIGTLAAPIAECGNVFGSARGDVGPLGVMDTLAIVRETEVNVNFTPPTGEITNATPNVIIGSVYGSGENGTVYENAKVTLTNGLVRGSVFGGGDGTDTYMVALKDPNNLSQYLDPSPQRSITSGKVYGNTEVVINGGQVLHNVFGGGNLASVGKGSYMGYGEMSASSITPSPTPYENSGTCTVTVTGGTIGTTGYPGDGYNNGFVFGSSKGTTFATVDNPEGTALYDYSRDFFLGYSNETEVIIGNPETDPLVDDGPRIWGSVFGGGENGHVRWHTNVTVNKGEIGKGYDAFSSVAGTPDMTADSMVYPGNVYGAGRGIDTIPIYTPGQPPQYCNLAGSVTLNTNVTVNGGIIHRNVYGGGSNASVGPSSTGYNPGTSTCTVNIKGGNIGEEFAVGEESFLYGGNIFGASRGSKVLIGTANIGLFATVNNTDVNIDSLRQGATVINTADVIGNVYGGGEVGQVTINTNVDMAYGNVKGSVYGGGKGVVTDEKAALVKGNATVNMTNGTVERSVYGGGQLGNVGTYTGYYTAEEIQNTAHVLNEPKGCEENTGMATVKISGGMVGKNGSLMPSPTSNPDDDNRGWVFCGGRGYADTIATGCQKANLLGIVGTTYLEISETDDTKPVITASVHGGCENGLTLGNTHVKIMGGQIGTGYNGGATNPWDEPYSEPLWTQAIEAINGGNPTTINNIAAQFHECDAFPYGIDHDEDPSTPDEYYVYDIFADETGYNSQGGSKQGSNGHSFFGNVFGGGSGYYPIAAGVWRRSAGRVWGDTRVEIEGGHILNNVYGGNETTDVMGKCTVTMEGGTVGIPRTIAQIEALPVVGVLFGGSMGDPRRAFDKWANVKETEVSVTGGTIFGSVFGGSAVGHVLEDAEVSISQAEGKTTLIGTWGYSGYDGHVFGGGKGDECNIDPVPRDNTTNPPTPAHPSFTPGRVGGNAHVAMSNGKVLGCLYGGGFSALTGVGEDGSFDSFINGSVYDSEHHGKTTVEVSGGIVGNLANDEGLTMLRSANKVGNVYGGGSGNPNENREDDLGRVANAVVNITNSPAIYGSVFGGGQMANVGHWNNYQSWYTEGTGFTQVTIEGSPTIGTALEFDHDHYATLNPPPTKTWYDTINGVRMISHTRTGNVYGGGQGNVTIDGQGYVVGTEHGHCHATYVNIGMNNGDDGGHIMSSVFGGSEEGAVWGETEVHITGGTIGTMGIHSDSLRYETDHWVFVHSDSTYSFGSVFGGSYGKDIYKHLNINNPTQQQLDSVNNLAGHVYGNTLVDITGGAIRGNVFGGGDMASVGIWDKVLDGNDNLIDIVAKNDPDRPAFRGNATVNVGGEAVIGPLDNTGLNAFVFGGGKGFSYDPDELRKAYSNVDSTFVTISGGKIWGSVYGGGSDSHVLGSTSVIVHSGANIGDDGLSTWDGNIFGGGRNFLNSNHTNGRVAGNVTIDMDGGTIQGSVFGGGRMALTGVNMLGNPYVTEHVYDSAFNNKPIHGLATINVSGTATTANGVTTYSTNIGNPNGNELLNGSNESVGDVFGSGKGDTKNYEDILAGRVANTKVGISGSPRIYGSVFGGGEMAGVGYWYTEDGKAKFYDKSGTSEVTIGREGESDNPVIGTDYEFTQEYAATNPEWTIYDDDGTIIHTCTGNVFGGCQGDVNITAPHWVSMGRSRNAKVVVNGGTIKSRVFGGAEQGSMAGNTSVVINGGTIGTLVTMSTNGGGGNGDGRDGETQYYMGGVYGGGYGSHNPAYNVTHNNDSTDISSDLLAGRVYGNARVDVLGGTVQGSVFGGASFAYLGGYGTNPHGNTKVYIGSESQMGIPDVGTTILGGVYGANNYNGTPYGDVEVHVYHTAHTGQPTTAGGNAYPTVPASGATPEWLATIPNDADNFALYQVFGGGNRANYTPQLAANKATVHVYGCEENTIYELYGGGNAAEIGSATAGYTTDANVIIEGGRIHSVFGGGNGNPDPANIYGTATTSVEGGLIDELFGGSNGYGNVNEINLVVAEDSDCELVIVNGFGGGNTSPEIGEIVTTLECCANPTPYNNFYGGAHSAVIFGNVTLNVYGGRITNLFGGSEGTQGLPADIKKYPTDWQTGDYSDEVKAFMQNHPDLAGTGGNVTVNLYGGTHTNVFGGCDVNGNIEGVVTVNVLDVEGNCPLKIANIYGASKETPYTPDDIIVEDVPQKPVSPVINVVHIKDTDGISQNVFGAGKGNTATVTSNPMVNIGYNHATMAQYIPLNANGDSIYHVQGRTPRAYVKGSVYGGGEYGKVIGNPSVNINRSNTVVDNFVYGAGCGNDTDIDCAKVTGGTTVRIIDGLIKRSVFGGGEMAIVTGDTKVEMSGGTVGSWETIGDEQYLHGSIYGGGHGSPNPVNEQYMDAADYGRVDGNTYIDISGNAHILKDVYGGGQMGSVGNGNLSDNTTGVAHVTISGGQIGPFVADKKNANVYGGGQGEVNEDFITHYTTHANVDSTSVIVCDSALVYGNVFGGSANGHVLAGTRVLVEKGNNTKDKKPIIGTDGMHGGDGHVYGGGQGNTSNFSAGRVGGNTKVVMTDGTVMGCIYGGGNVALTGVDVDGTFASFIDDDQKYDSIQHGMAEVVVSGGIIGNPANDGLDLLRSNQKLGNIYGGGRGDPNEYLEDDFGRAANADVSISGSPTIYGSVFGGGQMANVGHWNNYSDWYTTQTGTTRVTINGAPQIGTALEFDHDNYAIAEPLPIKTLYDTINDVRMISHTSTGNVFGGGQGDMIIDEEGDAEGFEQGHCCTTIVNINMNDGGHIMSSVFGGSEQGAVWGDTKVKIERGIIGTSGIEADSLGVDLDEWVTASNLYRFGSVFGGSYGVDSYKHLHSNDAAVADTANSYAGRVYGNTYVNITGGSICGNVFGGGNMASVGYWNKVLDDNDNLIDFVPTPYPNTIGIKGHAKVNVSGAAIIGPLDPNGLNASVYGGGKGIGDDPDDLRKKYGNVNSTEVTINLGETGHVYGSVFGGGADGHVLRDAVVNITGGTIGTTGLHDDGLVFGGGQGTSGSFSAGRVGGSTEVIMTDGTVLGNIYGGGSVALTGVDVNGSFESYESLVDGVHVYDSIRHGLARVEVSGGTIGNHNRSGLDLLLNDLRVGNIYGGGRGDLNEFREDDFGRSANAMVHIYNSPTIYGSVYGGGQMANVGRWNDYDTWYTQKTGTTKVTIDGTPTIGTEKEFDYAYSTGTGASAPKWTLYEVINGMRMITYTRTGNVYGSGQGNIKLDNDGYVVGTEHGHCRTTEVNISGTPTIMSSVYGGAEQGAVWGDTKVNITGGTIGTENIVAGNSDYYSYGSVYGGSYGMDAYTHLNLTNPSQQVLDSVNGLAGHVYGNTFVNITGGAVRCNVFGGGDMASVGEWDDDFVPVSNTGNATVNVSGSAIVGPMDGTGLNAYVFGGGKGIGNDPDNLRKKYCNLNSTEVTVSLGENGRVFGSLYGGGSDAHTLGDTHVKLLSGTIGTEGVTLWDGNIFGGGRNLLLLTYAAGRVGGNTSVEMMGGNVLGSVYGGGRNGLTGFSGDVISTGSNTYQALPDNTNDNTYGRTSVKISGGTVGNLAHMKDSEFSIGDVYGGGKGSKTGIDGHPASSALLVSLVKETEVEISGTARIYGNVYGGGEVGNVGNYTWNQSGNSVNGIAIIPNTGHAKVTVNGGIIGLDNMQMITESGYPDDFGHVFGGGEGWVESPNSPTNPVIDSEGNHLVECMASVRTTEVTISDEAFVLGSVYGGSNNGHVLDSTWVKIQGGQIGAGENVVDANGHNRPYTDNEWNSSSLAECASWTYQDGGNPYDINILNPVTNKPEPGMNGATFYGNVFGGGSGFYPYGVDDDGNSQWLRSSGQVKGNTRVEVTDGHILTSLYGGCETTDVGTYTYDNNIHGEVHVSGGKSTVIISGGTIGVPRDSTSIVNHPVTCHVYGSGKGDPRFFFNTWTNVWDSKVEIKGTAWVYGSVFGGGEEGHVLNNVDLDVSENAKIGTLGYTNVDGNVFGGGRGFTGWALTAGTVGGNIDIDITGGTMLGSVYGGGRLASVGTYLVEKDIPDPENPSQTVINPLYGRFQPGDNHGFIDINISGGTIGNDHEIEKLTHAKPDTKGGNVYGGCMGKFVEKTGDDTPIWPSLARAKETNVTITGTVLVKNSVYGGGEIGTLSNNATVNISGGTIGGNYGTGNFCGHVFGGGSGIDDPAISLNAENDSTLVAGYLAGRVYGNTTVNISGGQVYENVYGGGEVASVGWVKDDGTMVNGLAQVNMTGGIIGPLDDSGLNGFIFGGPKGGNDAAMKAYCNVNNTEVNVGYEDNNSNRVWGSLFGGGSDGHVLGNATVNVTNGTIGTTGITSLDGNVYGGGRNFHEVSETAGRVGGNTTVNILGGHMLGSVFGGGRLGSVGIDVNGDTIVGPAHGYTTVNVGGQFQIGDINFVQTGNIDIGHQITDPSHPDERVGGNVYGGAKGKAGAPGSLVTRVSKVKQTTVNIKEKDGFETWIEGSVFGSGEDGHVLKDTYVNIFDGQIGGHDYGDLEPCEDPYHGNVYGGGRGVDTYEDPEHPGTFVHSTTAGWVQGNTNVNMYGGHVIRNVYGGGNLASVGNPDEQDPQPGQDYKTGLASVTITGGTVGTTNEDENFGNVFGSAHGGVSGEYVHLAYVKNTHVTIGQTARIYGSVFGGGEDGHVRMNAIVDIEGGIIGDAGDVVSQPLDGNVYGGGRGLLLNGESQTAGEVYGYTTVNIKNSTYNEINYSPIIWNNVFGGGSQSVVREYKVVNVSGGLVHGSVFGGSREIPEQRPNKAPRFVNMWGGTVEGNVYGCSYYGIDDNPSNEQSYNPFGWASFVNISGGTIGTEANGDIEGGNVYGAGYGGRVKGSVAVLIGKNAIVETSSEGGEFNEINIHRQETPVIANLDIKGSVFGGSYGSIGSTEWDHSYNVVGYSRVYIDGTEYNTTNSSPAGITNYMNIGGGLYGCGTNCESGDEGRNILVRNYGKRNPEGNPDAELTKASRTLTTIQRADTVLLDNTNVNLSGAADISQSDSDRAFAVLQVDNGVYVTNASGIVLGTVDAPVFMDSIHEVKSLHLKEGIGSSYHNMTPSSNNNWEWIGVNPLNPSNPEGNTQENARLYYTQTAPSTPLNYNQENVIIFNGDSRLYVRYLDKSGGNKKRMYGQLQGFFRMRGDFFRPIGTESFAYARPKVTPKNNPIRIDMEGFDYTSNTMNGGDGGFLSYNTDHNFFTQNGQTVLYYTYHYEGDDGGNVFTNTKQYPYFNIGEYVQNKASGEMDLEEFREWVLPRLTGKIWYVDGRGIGNGGWGKDASHQAGWGHFPDMPKLTVSGDTDSKGICKDQTQGEVYNSFNFEEDIIYVVGPVEAIKEDVLLNQNTNYSLKLYRYPGGHKMSNGRNDNTVVDATHTAPIPSNTYDGLVNEGESSQMDPSLGPGANLGMMIHANKSNFVMENVLVDGLFGASEGDITTHNIPTSFTSTQMYNVNKPMVVTTANAALTLKGYKNTLNEEIVTNGTILQRGYNGIDAATTWYYDADYDCYTESTSGDQQVITVTPQGGGLFVDKDATSTVNVEGLVTIQNNKQRRMVGSDDRPVESNVYLPSFSKSLNISGELTATADATTKIGITSPMRNKEDSYKKNTFSPVAVASDKVNAQKAWEKGNFLDDQEWFFTNEDKTTYYLDKQNTSLNDKALYFGWTWANVVRREPKSGDLSGEVTDDFNITNINSPHDLAWLISLTSNMNGVDPGIDDLAGKTISQTNDINLKQYVWVPVGTNDKPLSGTYDGQGHLIDGLAIEYLSKTDLRYKRTNYGLFGDVNGGTINRTFVVGGLIVPDSIPYQSNTKVDLPVYNIGGLAGYLEGSSVVSNSEAAIAISSCDTYTAYAGGLVGELKSGEIHSSMAMPEMTIKAPSMAAPSMAGGLVGKSSGGSVNNSFVNAKFVFKNGGQGGGLLGTNEGTKVKNCYVALRETTASDNFDGLVKTQSSGSIDSCYVQDGYTFANSGSFDKKFTPVFNTDTYGYMYSDNKVLDADTAMFRLLNHWVDKTNKTTQKYAHWTRPTLHSINGDLPVLMLCNYDDDKKEGQGDFRSMATYKQGPALQYGGPVRDDDQLNTALGRPKADESKSERLFIYGDSDRTETINVDVANITSDSIAIYEHAAILAPGTLANFDKTFVGVTFDNTSRKAADFYGEQLDRDWHMFSTPLSNAPLGINYEGQNTNDPENEYYHQYNHWDDTPDDLPAFHFYPATSKDGYFPSAVPTGYTNPNCPKYKYPYDFYCWYEPEWQWINFKRNGPSHWHYDYDSGHDHPHIDYYAVPGSDENKNINEVELIPGKGYQLSIQEDTYLQSHGNLNNGEVTFVVVNSSRNSGAWGVGPLYFGNNLIGNPYHAYLDFVGTDENGFGQVNDFNSYYVYDADTAAKRHVDYLIYPDGGSTGGCYASRYIHPHQGFFIQYKPEDTDPPLKTLTFTPSMTVTRKDVENAGFREELPAYPLVNLFAYDWEDKGDVLVVEFNRPENGGGIKSKSLRNGNHLVFAHHGDDDYGAFFAKEGTKQVPVRFQSFEKEKKPYTFRWNLQNGDFRSLYLIDNMTGIQYDMLRNDSYSFEASKQDYLSRFLIVFDVTDVEEHSEDINFAFFDGSTWVVNGKGRLEVVDVLGRILHAETLHGDQNRVNLDNYAKGIYLLRLWEGDTPKIQKIIMH